MLSDSRFPTNSLEDPFVRSPLGLLATNPSSEPGYELPEHDLTPRRVQHTVTLPPVSATADPNNLDTQGQVTTNNSDLASLSSWRNVLDQAYQSGAQSFTYDESYGSLDIYDLDDETVQPGGGGLVDGSLVTPATHHDSLLTSSNQSPSPSNHVSPSEIFHFPASLHHLSSSALAAAFTSETGQNWESASQPTTSTLPSSTVAPALIRQTSAPGLHYAPQTSSYTSTVSELSPGGESSSSGVNTVSAQPHLTEDAYTFPNGLLSSFYQQAGQNITDESGTPFYSLPQDNELDPPSDSDETDIDGNLWQDDGAAESETPACAPSPHPSQCSESSNGSVAYAAANHFESPIGSPEQVQVYAPLQFDPHSPHHNPYLPLSTPPSFVAGEGGGDDDDEYKPAPSPCLSDDVVVPDPSLSAPSMSQTGGIQKRTFKVALWEVINNPAHQEYIRWSDDGTMGIVNDKRDFLGSSAMKAITDARDMGGFVRQLNMWGFSRSRVAGGSEHSMAFAHGDWQRGRPDLMEQMCRKGEVKLNRASNARRKKSKRGKKPTAKESETSEASTATPVKKPTAKAARTEAGSSEAEATKGVKRKRVPKVGAETDAPTVVADKPAPKSSRKSAEITTLAPRRWSNRVRSSKVDYRQPSEDVDEVSSTINSPMLSAIRSTSQGSPSPEEGFTLGTPEKKVVGAKKQKLSPKAPVSTSGKTGIKAKRVKASVTRTRN